MTMSIVLLYSCDTKWISYFVLSPYHRIFSLGLSDRRIPMPTTTICRRNGSANCWAFACMAASPVWTWGGLVTTVPWAKEHLEGGDSWDLAIYELRLNGILAMNGMYIINWIWFLSENGGYPQLSPSNNGECHFFTSGMKDTSSFFRGLFLISTK